VTARDPLAPLRPFLRNPLPAAPTPWVAGVLGDHPSTYSRSPALWNAAFAAAGVDAVFVPFDVTPADLAAFLDACHRAPGLLGFTVTVPHKERTSALLESLDADAEAIGAVNTVTRAADGRLAGGNTDGAAALEVVRGLLADEKGRAKEPARRPRPRVPQVLLLGAGGAARAVGVALGRGLPGSRILISARRREQAEIVAGAIRAAGGAAEAVASSALEGVLPDTALLINATSVGMTGPVSSSGGVTWLEPYSPLAPAEPPAVAAGEAAPEGSGRGPARPPAAWWTEAWPGIVRNLEVSLRRALRLAPHAVVLDLVYAPAETVLLKHARWTGHRTANGLGVLVAQAVDAFFRICRGHVAEDPNLRRAVRDVMHGAVR